MHLKNVIKNVLTIIVVLSILCSCEWIHITPNIDNSENIADPEQKTPITPSEVTPPEVTPPSIPKKSYLNISVVGDIMTHGPQIRSAKQADGSYNFNSVFDEIKPYIETSDIAIGNLETTISNAQKGYGGYPLFRSPENLIEALKYTGFDILTTANNHCLDGKEFGVKNTLDKLDDYGILHTGTARSQEESDKILIIDKNDIKIAILAYTYGTNGMEAAVSKDKLSYMVKYIDMDKIKNDVNKAKSQGADVIIACMHWGVEYMREQNQEQKNMADQLFNAGVDIVFGSHPHVLQPMEKKKITNEEDTEKDVFVIYSLGNFISNQRKRYQDSGIIVNIKIMKEGDKLSIEQVSYVPTWVQKFTHNNAIKYRILPVRKFMDGRLKGTDAERIQSVWKETTGLIGDDVFQPLE